MKRYLAVLFVVTAAIVGGVASRAYAHHSFAATYLEDQTVTIEGELVQFLFRNPHSFVHVMVKEKDGSMVRYAVEWGGAGELGQRTRDAGWGRGSLRPAAQAGSHPGGAKISRLAKLFDLRSFIGGPDAGAGRVLPDLG